MEGMIEKIWADLCWIYKGLNKKVVKYLIKFEFQTHTPSKMKQLSRLKRESVHRSSKQKYLQLDGDSEHSISMFQFQHQEDISSQKDLSDSFNFH